jgi:hypothetical protein
MTKAKSPATTPRHRFTDEDYPATWAHQIELALDKEERRLFLYGGVFGTFVLAMVVIALIGVFADTPPLGL